MTTYDFVHLVIHACGDRVEGRTKLQKTVYFVGVLTQMLDSLGYRPHFYGPFSPDVASAVEDLRGLNFLKQETQAFSSRDSRGFEVARFDYCLTNDGKEIAQEKVGENPAEWSAIQRAVKRLQSVKADDYMKLSIAAKAYFMLGKSAKPMTPEMLSKTAQRFGWKVTESELNEASDWLTELGLVETAKAT